MKIDDILTLIKAGYTKEDIEALNSAPAEEPKKEPAPEPKKEEPKPEPEPKPEEDKESKVLKEMQELRKSIMKLAVVNGAAEIKDDKDKLEEALKKLIGG